MPSFKDKKKDNKVMKSFRFSASIESMLKYIAEKDGRSETKELEYLIRQRYVMMKDIENNEGIIVWQCGWLGGYKMLIKTITDNKIGKKWEIYKEEDNKHYRYVYYEFYSKIGWRKIAEEKNFTKDAIEWGLDIILGG